ncbi:MAG: site-2 protease family protein [Bacteroidia bacterium]|nr:site-2 protease family protein [Bacteroidia bacterium]
MDPFNPEEQQQQTFSGEFPPKPVVMERSQNALTRSLISLLVYAGLFYIIFDQNVTYIAAILLVIIVHELGHFAFMKLFHYSNVKIFIVPLLGAFTSGKKQQVSQWQLSLIILGGPVPGIIIGTLLYLYNRGLHNETITMLSNSFLIINLLNCLPFHPLDGGRLVETLFFKENYAIRIAFGIASIIALVCICFVVQSFILLIIPVLIGFEIYNENKHQKIRDYLKQEKIDYHVEYADLTDKNYWLIRDCLIFSFPKKYAGIIAGQYQYSHLEALFVQHVNSVLQVNLKQDLNWFKRLLVLIFYILITLSPIVLFVIFR